MARAKKQTSKKTVKKTSPSKRTYSLGDRFASKTSKPSKTTSVLDRVRSDWTLNTNINQNSFTVVLGALIVIILGVLFFNYFRKPPVTPPQVSSTSTDASGDVSKDSLPGKYTVKDGDTLFTIAQKYYDNGYLFTKISEANQLSDDNSIQVGQVLEIPKVDTTAQATEATPAPTPSETPMPSDQTSLSQRTQPVQGGTGGSTSQTEWGEAISGTTYTVQPGDWLSTIAGRAYGDVFAYTKIAQANNISDPNVIEPGMVLQIPR